MHRDDKSLFMLYIEPKKEERSEYPINDMLSIGMEIAIEESIEGASNYSKLDQEPTFYHGSGFMGWHGTDCGESSDNHDYLLKTGHITNSLAPFYLKWYRNSISRNDMMKIREVLLKHMHEIPYSSEEIYEKCEEINKL